MANKKRHILRSILLIIGGLFLVFILMAIFAPEKYRNMEPVAAAEKTESHINFLMRDKLKEAPVFTGAGEKMGTRAYIEIKRADLEKVTLEDFTEFYKSFENKEYMFVSIFCEDGGGVAFGNHTFSFRTELDEDGAISGGEQTRLLVYDDKKDIFFEME